MALPNVEVLSFCEVTGYAYSKNARYRNEFSDSSHYLSGKGPNSHAAYLTTVHTIVFF